MKKTSHFMSVFVRVILVFCCLLLSLTQIPLAKATTGINPQINFQGKLTNSDGTNVTDGTGYQLVFKIYNVSSGGSAIWTETQSSVSVTSGIFQVALGSVTTFSGAVDFNNTAIYLGIQVTKNSTGASTTDSEMTPRIQFAAVPYAFNAQQVNGLTLSGTNATSFTFPSTSGGTVITSTAPTQTITSTQVSGNAVTLADPSFTTTGSTLENLTFTNANTSAGITTNGLSITPTGSIPSSSTNVNNSINFPTVTTVTNNTFNGLNFGTGYNNLITSANASITAAGAITATTEALAPTTSTTGLSVAATGVPTVNLASFANSSGQEPTGQGINALQLTWDVKPNPNNLISAERINILNNNTGTGGQAIGLHVVATGPGGSINSTTSGIYIAALSNASTGSTNQNAIEVAAGGWNAALKANGNVVLGTQANASSAIATLNSAAGTFGSQTSVQTATSSAIFNGKLFVATNKFNAAGVYRYDGGTTWTLVTHAAGQVITGDTANINGYVLAVYNGALYIGSQTATGIGTAALYSSTTADTTADSFTLINTTRGTFVGTSGMDAVSDIEIWNGNLYVATAKTTSAAVYRYSSGTGAAVFVAINSAVGKLASGDTANADSIILQAYDGMLIGAVSSGPSNQGRVEAYSGNGTTWTTLNSTAGTFGTDTAVSNVTSMAVYNGTLFVGTGLATGNSGSIYKWNGSTTAFGLSTAFVRITSALGQVNSGDTASTVTDVSVLKPYNGRLYAGSMTSGGTAALYQYDGTSAWTLVNGTRGTFGSDTSVIGVGTMVEFNGTLYVGTQNASAGSVYTFTYTQGNSYALRFDSGSANPNYGSISFVANQQADDHTGHEGTFLFSNAIAMGTGAFDYAEDYPTTDTTLSGGDLVSIDPKNTEYVLKSGLGIGLVGVVSTHPGFELGPTSSQSQNAKYVPVALTGRVPVNVSTQNGTINAGDYLTASATTPGIAVKATSPGPVIGRAMQNYSATIAGQITVFVNASYFDGIHDVATGLNGVDPSAMALANSLLNDTTSSQSAVLSSLDASPSATLRSLNALLPGALATVSGDLEIQGDATNHGAVRIFGIFTLNNNAVFAKLAEFFGSTIFHSDVAFMGRPTFNNDSAGFAIIKAGASDVGITFDHVYTQVPIVVVSPDTVTSYAVTASTVKGFTIHLQSAQGTDIRFSWTATAVNSAKTFVSDGTSSTPVPTVSPSSTPLVSATLQPDFIPSPSPSSAPSATVAPSPSSVPVSPLSTPVPTLTTSASSTGSGVLTQ